MPADRIQSAEEFARSFGGFAERAEALLSEAREERT